MTHYGYFTLPVWSPYGDTLPGRVQFGLDAGVLRGMNCSTEGFVSFNGSIKEGGE